MCHEKQSNVFLSARARASLASSQLVARTSVASVSRRVRERSAEPVSRARARAARGSGVSSGVGATMTDREIADGLFAADAERSDGGVLGTAARSTSRGDDDAFVGPTGSSKGDARSVHIAGMDDDTETFSVRKFLAFLGPGFLMCIGYVDPGNFESDLQAGVQYGYSLLWVLLWATIAGLFVQAMCVRLALATGWHLARVMRDEYPPRVRYALWVATELAIVASDIPEVIGTALALKLIFGLPTAWGVGITSLSTLLFLGLQSFGVRKLEAFIGALVGVMSVCFVAQMSLLGGGDGGEVVAGIVAPVIRDPNALFIAISLLGAVVMPHNLFLHSALVLSRTFALGERALRSAYKYNVAECASALLVTLVINFAVVIVAARSIRDADFHDPTGERRQGIIDRPLQNAPEMLKDVLGVAAKGMFAAALLASGQSSTITGTYAGQFVMEGFLELRIDPVLRAFLTRSAAIVPSLLVILIAGDEYAEFLIVVSSVILFVQLPYALIPLVKFCGDPGIAGPLALDLKTARATRVLCVVVVLANSILLVQMIHESRAVNGTAGGVFVGFLVAFAAVAYVGSIAWLAARPVSQNLATRVERRMRGERAERLSGADDGGIDDGGIGGEARGDDARGDREMRGVASAFRVDTPPLPPGDGGSRV